MRYAFVMLALLLVASDVRAAEVHLQDGSVIIGEILRLIDGEDLIVDTEHMDEVTIEWEAIESIRGTKIVDVELFDGRRYFGRMHLTKEGMSIRDGTGEIARFDPSQIYAVDQFNQTWRDGLEASTDLGVNIVRGNNQVTQLSFGGRLAYDAKNFETSIDATTIINEQTESDDTRRFTLGSDYTYKLPREWTLSGLFSFEADEQQNLEGRSLFGGAFGRRLVNSRRNRFRAYLGIAVNSEKFLDEPTTETLEGLVGFDYRRRAFADIDLSYVVLPNIQGTGRVRAQLDGSLSFDLFSDLDFKVTFYDRYDSQPPEGNDENDTGVTLGVSWSY
jgi:putative salt-induced outer membrane protein YdiY